VRSLGAPEQQSDHDRGEQQGEGQGQVGDLLRPPPAGTGRGDLRREVAAQLAERRIGGASFECQRVGGAVDGEQAQLRVEHAVILVDLVVQARAGRARQLARGQDRALARAQRAELACDLHGATAVGQRPPQQAALLVQQQVELAEQAVGLAGGRVAAVQRQVRVGDQPEQQDDPDQDVGPAPALAHRRPSQSPRSPAGHRWWRG